MFFTGRGQLEGVSGDQLKKYFHQKKVLVYRVIGVAIFIETIIIIGVLSNKRLEIKPVLIATLSAFATLVLMKLIIGIILIRRIKKQYTVAVGQSNNRLNPNPDFQSLTNPMVQMIPDDENSYSFLIPPPPIYNDAVICPPSYDEVLNPNERPPSINWRG